MSTSNDVEESEDNRRRRALILIVIALMLLGTGVGTIIFTGTETPPTGNETTPTATPTLTPNGTATPTPGGPGPPSETDTPTATPGTGTATPAPTATPTPDGTGTEEPGGGSTSGGGGGSDPPATPSPGLELGGDGQLLDTAGLVPGESGEGTLTLRNAENVGGNLSVTVVDVTDEENGVTDPESSVDSSPDEGELSSHLEVRVAIEDGSTREYVLGTESGYVPLEDLPANAPSSEYLLESGEEVTLVMEWRLPSSAGNEIQSDGVTVDLGLLLESTNG